MIGGLEGRAVHAEAGGGADQSGAADMHFLDGGGKSVNRLQIFHHEAMRQLALIDDLDKVVVFRVEPDGTIVDAVYQHDCKLPEEI